MVSAQQRKSVGVVGISFALGVGKGLILLAPYPSKRADLSMSPTTKQPGYLLKESLVSPENGEMVELALLLPNWQLEELETAAHDHGLTTGQMIRRLIAAFLHEPA